MTISVSNVPASTSITLKQGATLNLSLTFNRTPTVPLNLTDYIVKIMVRKQFGSDDAVITATSDTVGDGAGKVGVVDPLAGQVVWAIIPSDTSSFLWSSKDDDTVDLPFDVELHRVSSDIVYSPIRGTITLVREVTR
jgi:hypothetical protein